MKIVHVFDGPQNIKLPMNENNHRYPIIEKDAVFWVSNWDVYFRYNLCEKQNIEWV